VELQIRKDVTQAYINQIKATTPVTFALVESFVWAIQLSLRSVLHIPTVLVGLLNQSFVPMVRIRTEIQRDWTVTHNARHVLSDIFANGVKYPGNAAPATFAIKVIQLQHLMVLISRLEKYVPMAFTVLQEQIKK
jgi:hypothetical protein